MRSLELGIERVGISLHGVSQEVAQDAVSGLEGELVRRIATFASRAAVLDHADLAEVALGPLTVPANIDAGALRALIADALIGQLLDAYTSAESPSDTPSEVA